jgi:hypothetical protein
MVAVYELGRMRPWPSITLGGLRKTRKSVKEIPTYAPKNLTRDPQIYSKSFMGQLQELSDRGLAA